MSRRDNERPPQFFIGPKSSNDPESLLDEARQRVRDEDELNKESTKLARRLLVAFVIILLMGVVFYIVLPYYGLRLPPFVPFLCFGAIATGAILSLNEGNGPGMGDDDDEDDDTPGSGGGCNDGGCAVGMCPGPRPLRMFKDPKDK